LPASQPANLLDLKPRRLMSHEMEGDRAVVLIPRFRARWLGWLQRRLRRPHVKLRLDDVGTAFWLSCDGATTLEQIGRTLQARFGEQVEPVWDRLALFVRQMHHGGLLELPPAGP
jgi:hypothetical protein